MTVVTSFGTLLCPSKKFSTNRKPYEVRTWKSHERKWNRKWNRKTYDCQNFSENL